MTSVVLALFGGLLLGLSTSLLLLFDDREAGSPGIIVELPKTARGAIGWRAVIVGGLLAGGLIWQLYLPARIGDSATPGLLATVLAGLLVGVGTRLPNQYTRDDDAPDVATGTVRSIVATITFMATGAAVILVVRLMLGGAR